MALLRLLAALGLTACFGAQSTTCPSGSVCPPGLVCIATATGDACGLPTCGDGVLDPGEACDDGNHVDGDGCAADCNALCGNGVVDRAEECDDGGFVDGDGCSSRCVAERCNNGVVDVASGETCDDGNYRDHDGCSSNCAREVRTWRSLAELPAPRAGHAAAYDARRGRVVMFGGCAATHSHCADGALGDTWEWDGALWRRRANEEPGPSARFGHAMTYDAARGVVILFGGCASGSLDGCPLALDDVWQFDGLRWEQLPGQPEERFGHALSYDSGRQRVVLYGGRDRTGGWHVNPWEWDGATWQPGSMGPGPDERERHAMAYDPARGETVMFGGRARELQLGDSWAWNGTSWRALPPNVMGRSGHAMAWSTILDASVVQHGCVADAPPTPMTGPYECMMGAIEGLRGPPWEPLATTSGPPPPRSASVLVADSARQRLVAFGGISMLNVNDTWELAAGTTWIQRSPVEPAPEHGAFAYDIGRGRGVFVANDYGGTWEWDGGWTRVPTATMPTALYGFAIAYDLERRTTLLFGGSSGPEDLDETWEWDGTMWRELAPARRPPPRQRHALAYDPVRKRVVLQGGRRDVDYLDDTWEWDGATWISRGSQPSDARAGHSMTYDVARQRVLSFAGMASDNTLTADLRAWDGETWIGISNDGPSPRQGHALAYDPLRQRVVVFGGVQGSAAPADLWEWDGAVWTQQSTASFSLPRGPATMIFDAVRGALVMHAQSSTTSPLDRTWVHRFEAPGTTVNESCGTGFDGDRDGKIGCDDPDCAARCAPASAAAGVSGPTCGDGRCTGIETCRLCPDDCGTCRACGDLICDPGETCAACPGDCPC